MEEGAVFKIHPPQGQELLRFCANGDIYIRGEKVDSNQDVWLRLQALMDSASLSIRELVDDSWQTAENKGFHSKNKSFAEDCALFHSEISEAFEEYRNGHAPNEVYYPEGIEKHVEIDGKIIQHKPEGVPIELADVIIRIADVSKTYGIDLEAALRIKAAYNKTRPHLHGGKKL